MLLCIFVNQNIYKSVLLFILYALFSKSLANKLKFKKFYLNKIFTSYSLYYNVFML